MEIAQIWRILSWPLNWTPKIFGLLLSMVGEICNCHAEIRLTWFLDAWKRMLVDGSRFGEGVMFVNVAFLLLGLLLCTKGQERNNRRSPTNGLGPISSFLLQLLLQKTDMSLILPTTRNSHLISLCGPCPTESMAALQSFTCTTMDMHAWCQVGLGSSVSQIPVSVCPAHDRWAFLLLRYLFLFLRN